MSLFFNLGFIGLLYWVIYAHSVGSMPQYIGSLVCILIYFNLACREAFFKGEWNAGY